MGKHKFCNTFYGKIYAKLETLEVGETICKVKFIRELYENRYDYYCSRSFDVSLAKAKSLLPDRKFVGEKRKITRIQ